MMPPDHPPLDDLTTEERRNELPWLEGTLLAAMRTWVLGCKRGVPADAAVRGMFANLRALEASEHLGRFMTTLSQGCTRMISVYCTCEPTLSADEVVLLDIFAMMQEEQHEVATDLLQQLVRPEAAYTASGDVHAIVQLLNGAGNTIARGPDAVRRHAQGSDLDLSPPRMPMRLH